jgi:CRISPR-associated protein Cas5d
MSEYQISFEVAGTAAMFARPDTGGTPTSYPVPTWSAAKGLFESIAFFADGAAWICPTRVEVCRRVGEQGGQIQFQRYTTNYGGPLRKTDQIGKGTNMQFFATIVSDVCYRLHGIVVNSRWKERNDPGHHLRDLFNRRLRQGRCFRTPCLGWSEFLCSYWGPIREGLTEVDTALSTEIPSMLLGIWSGPTCGRYAPEFLQNVKVTEGVLKYNVPEGWLLRENREVMRDAQ